MTTYIFDHIYKTGGTTFALSYLVGAVKLGLLPRSEVFVVRGHLNQNRTDLDYLMSLPNDDRSRLRIICGHNAGVLRSAFSGARFITLVRNPVDRVISGYLHARYHGDAGSLIGREIEEERVSLGDFVKRDLFAARYAQFVSVKDAQAKVLLGPERPLFDDGTLQKSIQSRFHLVGCTESLELFLYLLHLKDGFPLILFNNRLVRKERDCYMPRPECLQVVREYNRFDQLVYECVRREFDRQVSETWTSEHIASFNEYLTTLRKFRHETGGDENAYAPFVPHKGVNPSNFVGDQCQSNQT